MAGMREKGNFPLPTHRRSLPLSLKITNLAGITGSLGGATGTAYNDCKHGVAFISKSLFWKRSAQNLSIERSGTPSHDQQEQAT